MIETLVVVVVIVVSGLAGSGIAFLVNEICEWRERRKRKKTPPRLEAEWEVGFRIPGFNELSYKFSTREERDAFTTGFHEGLEMLFEALRSRGLVDGDISFDREIIGDMPLKKDGIDER